jgi:hypothetical protein
VNSKKKLIIKWSSSTSLFTTHLLYGCHFTFNLSVASLQVTLHLVTYIFTVHLRLCLWNAQLFSYMVRHSHCFNLLFGLLITKFLQDVQILFFHLQQFVALCMMLIST